MNRLQSRHLVTSYCLLRPHSTTVGSTRLPGPPECALEPVTLVGSSGVDEDGVVSTTGGEAPTVALFYGDYGRATDRHDWERLVELGLVEAVFGARVSGLISNSPCYFRSLAENDAGSTWFDVLNLSKPDTAQVIISEVQSSNLDTSLTGLRGNAEKPFVTDPYSPDWTELENTNDVPIDIGGHSLSNTCQNQVGQTSIFLARFSMTCVHVDCNVVHQWNWFARSVLQWPRVFVVSP